MVVYTLLKRWGILLLKQDQQMPPSPNSNRPKQDKQIILMIGLRGYMRAILGI